MSRGWRLFCAALSIGLLVSACGNDAPAPPPQAAAGVELQGDLSGSGPGTLLSARSLPTLDLRLRSGTSLAGRVEYTSTSGITDAETKVTGSVFAPKGEAPDGGWPIVALGHPTSGIESGCAPSLSPSLLGLTPLVTILLQAGYVVTVPDYQGLGSDDGYHPYLEPTTAGYNLIDAVRAARKFVPDTSDRWVAVGNSQGGQAAWAANELAAAYGKGLSLLGAVAFAPPLELGFLADAAVSGDLTTDQKAPYQWLLEALSKENPDFDLDSYRRGVVEQNWDLLLECNPRSATERTDLIGRVTADDLRPNGDAAVERLRDLLRRSSLPKIKADAPMLVIYGDKDTFIPVESTDRALAEACDLGDVIDIQRQPGKGHDDIDLTPAVGWISDRFNDRPAPDSCAPPPPPPPPPAAAPEAAREGE